MISLKEPDAPYTLDLPYGIQVTVKPLTTSSMLSAQAIARRKVKPLEEEETLSKEAGLNPDYEDSDAYESAALFQMSLLQELATRHIVNWQGVERDGKAAPLTAENIKAVMELYPVGEKFLAEFTLKQMLLNTAKNASGLSVNGTTPPLEGPTTAKGVNQNADNPISAPTLDTAPRR